MLNLKTPLITGYMKRIVVRENGQVETEECENTVFTAFVRELNDALRTDTNYALDFLQTTVPTQSATYDAVTDQAWSGKDFIVVGASVGGLQAASGSSSSGNAFGLAMVTATEPTSTSSLFQGSITDTAITIPNDDEVQIGRAWTGQSPGFEFATAYAKPSSWSSLTLASGDSLTIQWTFTIS